MIVNLTVSVSTNLPPSIPCPCGSGQWLSDCCGPYLQGQRPAPTAEALMRSRYSAYCTKTIDYLVKTHHPQYREPHSRHQIAATANSVTWLGLTIIATEQGQAGDQTGIVEFVALFQDGKRAMQLHERSRFRQEMGQWFYLDGDLLPPLHPKKNEPCWCKSGKTFKQCHGKKR
ncbi:YchJ family protein [Spirulina major CS-329]|uniref:YchJ family protein n=1 Tax=Spirulina TaxID=1154 RepID=UPI0023313F0E|nr:MULTISPECIES: YchJ family protein [Spirulina]MDB9496340.1 YchJ family protein [Spirulina subsalsa CS-330]MDB9502776.1 YchJ family protein [Spirulina major CS-329]